MNTAPALPIATFSSRRRFFKRGRFWLAISALIPLLGLLNDPPDLMLPIYTLFVLAFFGRRHVQRAARRVPLPVSLFSVVLFVVAGLLTETLAWASSYLANEAEPALLHPQLFADWILAVPLYGSWGVTWVLLRRRWDFTLRATVVLMGLYGILAEQLGAVFITGLFAMPAGLLLWTYVFAVYGAFAGLAVLPIEPHLLRPGATRGRWTPLVAFAALLVISSLIMVIVGELLPIEDWLPDKQSIREHPFW